MARLSDLVGIARWGLNGSRWDIDDPTQNPPLDRDVGFDESYSQLGGNEPQLQQFNQIMLEFFSWMDQINRKGSVPRHSDLVNYKHFAFCVGSDGHLYRTRQDSGPAHGGAVDPVGNDTHWKLY